MAAERSIGAAERVGEGREAEVFAWGEGRVLRLHRDPAAGHRAEQEAVVLRAAAAAGVPVPIVEETVTVEDRPGIVMERIDGGDSLSELGRRPWRLLAAARQLGRLQADLHDVVAPAELTPLRALLRGRIGAAPHLSQPARAFVGDVLESLPDGDRICHGDFHPGNVMLAARGPVIIDWTNTARGEPMGDLARTTLLLSVGQLPPGMSTLARAVDRLGRTAFRRIWVRGYRRARSVDGDAVERWLTVWAAARLAERIPEEVPSLLALLRRAGCPP